MTWTCDWRLKWGMGAVLWDWALNLRKSDTIARFQNRADCLMVLKNTPQSLCLKLATPSIAHPYHRPASCLSSCLASCLLLHSKANSSRKLSLTWAWTLVEIPVWLLITQILCALVSSSVKWDANRIFSLRIVVCNAQHRAWHMISVQCMLVGNLFLPYTHISTLYLCSWS